MAISAILQLKKDSYLIISPEKFKIKPSKIEKDQTRNCLCNTAKRINNPSGGKSYNPTLFY